VRRVRRLLPLVLVLAACAPQDDGYGTYDFAAQCEELVTRQLKAPATARFESSVVAKQAEIRTTTEGYEWVGWVDAQNGFGALVRTKFTCTFDRAQGDVQARLH
jgi:hypothetical protein